MIIAASPQDRQNVYYRLLQHYINLVSKRGRVIVRTYVPEAVYVETLMLLTSERWYCPRCSIVVGIPDTRYCPRCGSQNLIQSPRMGHRDAMEFIERAVMYLTCGKFPYPQLRVPSISAVLRVIEEDRVVRDRFFQASARGQLPRSIFDLLIAMSAALIARDHRYRTWLVTLDEKLRDAVNVMRRIFAVNNLVYFNPKNHFKI